MVPGSLGPQLVTEQLLYYGHLLGGLGDPGKVCGVTLGREMWFNSVQLLFLAPTSFTGPLWNTSGHVPHLVMPEHQARSLWRPPPGLRTHSHMHTSRSLS